MVSHYSIKISYQTILLHKFTKMLYSVYKISVKQAGLELIMPFKTKGFYYKIVDLLFLFVLIQNKSYEALIKNRSLHSVVKVLTLHYICNYPTAVNTQARLKRQISLQYLVIERGWRSRQFLEDT